MVVGATGKNIYVDLCKSLEKYVSKLVMLGRVLSRTVSNLKVQLKLSSENEIFHWLVNVNRNDK